MILFADGRNGDWGFTAGSYVIGVSGRVECDSVTRSGNTVTIHNVRLYAWLTNDSTPGHSNIGYMTWYSTYNYNSLFIAGGNTQTRGYSVGAGTYYPGHQFLSQSYGDISFTVSASATSATIQFHFSNDNEEGSRRTGTVTFPANTKYLNVNVNKVDSSGNRTEVSNGTVGKFDEYVPNNTKIGSQVSDQVGWDYAAGTTYKINNVTEQSADWYYTGNSEYSGTLNSDTTIQLDFKATSVPTGLDAALVSRAWNQVVAKATCSGFGAPNNRASRSISVGVAASSGTAWSNCYTTQSTTAATATGNKTFTHANLKGCAAFKLGAYATNTKKSASVLESTVYYLPPAPMASVTLNSTTRNEKNVTFKVRATGKAADGTNNVSGAKVNLQYRYSTDGGTTYSAWTNAATNYTPNTAQDFNVTAKYNTAVKVQVRQATYQDTSQVTAALTLDIAAVHPIPKDPTLTFSWDELDRIFTSVATNTGTGGDTGDSSLKRFEYQVSWNSDFSSPFVSTTPTTSPYTYTIPYLKPLRTLYVRVRTVNNWDLTSNWVSVHPTVPRPLWGLVKGTSTASGNVETIEIRDMVKVKTDNTVSARDWIEGTNNGKKRIVNT